MEKTIIYRDEARITESLRAYRKAQGSIQILIDALRDTGLKIDDDVLVDLASGGMELKRNAQEQIEHEAGKFTLKLAKEEQLNALKPLLKQLDEIIASVRQSLFHTSFNRSFQLNVEYFRVKDLQVSLVEDIEQRVTDELTIYADTSVRAEAYRRALELKDKIEEFEAYLREMGDLLHPVGAINILGQPTINATLVNVTARSEEYHVDIDGRMFYDLATKRR